MQKIENPERFIRVGIIPANPYTKIEYRTVDRARLVDELKPLVNGWIEVVRPPGFATLNRQTGRTHILIVDEEGLLKQKPLNARASVIYGLQTHGQPIVGDVVLATEALFYDKHGKFWEPDIYGLPEDFALDKSMIDDVV